MSMTTATPIQYCALAGCTGCKVPCLAAQHQRIRRKPTLLQVINGNRRITVIRLAQTSQLSLDIVREVMRSNQASPEIAARIATGLTIITEHHYSVMDIDITVSPQRRATCPTPETCDSFGCRGVCRSMPMSTPKEKIER